MVFLKIFNWCRKLKIKMVVEWKSKEDPDQRSRWFYKSGYGFIFFFVFLLMSQFSHLVFDMVHMSRGPSQVQENFL